MRKKCRAVILFIACLFIASPGKLGADVKYADLAGKWYRASPSALSKELSGYLDKAKNRKIKGTVVSVISPHAGFSYSGPVAAHSFKALAAADPKTLIVVGFTHMRFYPGTISVFTQDAFVTPLGKAEINSDITSKLLLYDPAIKDIPEAFDGENSIEMLIPFIQSSLPEVKVVLVAVCDQNKETADILAEALYSVMSEDETIMAVASTDMCHGLGQKETVKKDSLTIEKLAAMEPYGYYRYSLEHNHELMCGQGAVYAVMKASQKIGANNFEVLKYATSADTSGDKTSVVGYLSAAFVIDGERKPRDAGVEKEEEMFSLAEKKKLLKIARDTIDSYLSTGEKPDLDIKDNNLNLELGGFVTLHEKGSLRGCIGKMVGDGPFYRTVMDMAISAAFHDPRFSQVRMGEMDDIDIEISALSVMEKINDPSEIVMGKHGVMVKMGSRSGVYLPQVAKETNWSRDEFMDSLCAQKARIPQSAWRTGDAEIFIFTAEVFSEKDLGMGK